jgi:hypothetical protein
MLVSSNSSYIAVVLLVYVRTCTLHKNMGSARACSMVVRYKHGELGVLVVIEVAI